MIIIIQAKVNGPGQYSNIPPNSEAIGSKEFNITQDCPKEVPKFKGLNVLFIYPQ